MWPSSPSGFIEYSGTTVSLYTFSTMAWRSIVMAIACRTACSSNGGSVTLKTR